MLMAMSLAEKLGDKGLVALSLHPGVIITNLGTHLDWEKDFAGMSKLPCPARRHEGTSQSTYITHCTEP